MQEKKRNQERNAAMLTYVGIECEAVSKAAGAYTDEKVTSADNKLREDMSAAVSGMCNRVENLEKGIIPDYEKATAAVNAVNDFNQGISNLLNYDPVSALAAQRERERQGE
jgi:hypothetical protein